MRFRSAYNPHHGKDGKFSSKTGGGGAGATGQGSGAVAGGPGGEAQQIAMRKSQDATTGVAAISEYKAIQRNKEKNGRRQQSETKRQKEISEKLIKDTDGRVSVDLDGWNGPDMDTVQAIKSGLKSGPVLGKVVNKGKNESIVRKADGSYQLAPNADIKKTVGGGPKKMKFKDHLAGIPKGTTDINTIIKLSKKQGTYKGKY